IRSYLKDSGYTLETAENGESAVARFCAGQFDLVLMDMQMPVMDGYGATERIRAWEREHGRRPVPILALTAYALPHEQEKSVAAGFTAHLSKPISRQTLLSCIRQHTAAAGPARIEVHASGTLRDILPGYLERQRAAARAIEAAIRGADYETIGVLGHRIRG